MGQANSVTSFYDSKFEYWNKEAWKKNLEKPLQEVYKSLSILEELGKVLKEAASGGNLASVAEKDKELLKFFLGGIKEDGSGYKEYSLAGLTRSLYGLYVDPKQYVETMKSPIKFDQYRYIEIHKTYYSESGFIDNDIVKSIKQKVTQLLKKLNINISDQPSDSEIKERIVNPQKILDDLWNLYHNLVSLTANYNYYTFFTLSTRLITKKYLEAAYPKLMNNFEEMKRFLGLKEIYIPKVEEYRKSYTLYTHSQEGLCDLLYTLNSNIWIIIQSKVFTYVTEPIDLRTEYRNLIKLELQELQSEIHMMDTLKKIIGPKSISLVLSDPIINVSCYYGKSLIGFSEVYHYRNFLIGFSELLDALSPIIFVTPEILNLKEDGNLVIEIPSPSSLEELVFKR